MLQLINPLWLWAIAGIIVPIMIHLWHVKNGKTLKIGSISLLGESARQNSRNFRITDWLLLILRCLLLISLAILLTSPFWQQPATKFKSKGWVLLEKRPVKTVYQRFKPEVDSLLKAGYELHEFNASFKTIKPEEISKDSVQNLTQSYWTLLKLLEQKIPQKMPVYLFTSNQLQYFKGSRPNVGLNLHWKTFTPQDSVSSWIQNAYLTPTDSIDLIVGKSTSDNTSFTKVKLQSGDRGNPLVNVYFESGRPVVSLKNNPQPPIPVDTSTLKIAVFQDRYSADARYLEAVLQAVKNFNHRKMKVVSAVNVNQIRGKEDWIFWLSDIKPPKNIGQKLVSGGRFFKYETGKVQQTNSWISEADDFWRNKNGDIRLYQRFYVDKNSIENLNAETVWQDGFGTPILSSEENGGLTFYHFYSRFDPSWNDLAWSNDFPKMILNLIVKSYPQQDFSMNDKRAISSGQLQISSRNQETSILYKLNLKEETDLKHLFWTAAFLLFLLERIISSRIKKEEIYG